MLMPNKILILLLIALVSAEEPYKLRLVKEWNELDFNFPDENVKNRAIENGLFIRGNPIPIDVDVFYDKNGKTKIFVTMPRFDTGRPYTLAKVRDGKLLDPYPDFSWQNMDGKNCAGITSVFRIAIDECARLWVVDTGKIGSNNVCPPKLLVFDLHSDTLIHQHVYPSALYYPHSILVTPVVDVRDPYKGCRNTFVYVADITGFGIIVYDQARDKSWRVENKLMYPFPPQGTFTIQGESFDLMDGIIGMALSPLKNEFDDRTLYFHSLASITENYVKTSVIRNDSAWQLDQSTANPRDFKVFEKLRISQAAAQGMDRSGIMFFGLMSSTAIGCWNTNGDFKTSNMDIVAYDQKLLQFASGVKVVNNLKGEQELWVLTCRFQKVMTGTMSRDSVNFRIQAGKIKDLVADTRCARPNGFAQNQGNIIGSSRATGSSNYGGASLN